MQSNAPSPANATQEDRGPRLSVVVIGRNEGERLRRCLRSLGPHVARCVYVDSGSRDDSVAFARSLGAQVVELDPARPFTAARARNEGVAALARAGRDVEFVQFVDGDCEVMPGWLEAARLFLEGRRRVAVACGRRRERFPDRSIYNWLCDQEWNTPVGEATACGGDALMRVAAFEQVGGFDPELIAGEEPELCVRLRAAGWSIWRLEAEMTLHDAAMLRFGQWWQRSVRAGHAFAEGAAMHGGTPSRHWVREASRAWLWGLGIPLAVLAALPLIGNWALLGLWVYPLQVLRLARRAGGGRNQLLQALFLVLGKFPELQGQLKYGWSRLRDRRVQLIEYK